MDAQKVLEGINKELLIEKMRFELPVLRAKIDMTQDEISALLGISRQTYSSIETDKRRMTWNTFMSVLFIFYFNPATTEAVDNSGLFPNELKKCLTVNHRI